MTPSSKARGLLRESAAAGKHKGAVEAAGWLDSAPGRWPLLMGIWIYASLAPMKTTVEMSDALLTELKVIAAREDRKLREVMEEVVSLGLRERRASPARKAAVRAEAEAWVNRWQDLGRRIEEHAVDPRPCVEILLDDRR